MEKKITRQRRARRTRMKIRELGAHRLTVHRTPRHIYAQIIAPNGSVVVAAASTVEKQRQRQGRPVHASSTRSAEPSRLTRTSTSRQHACWCGCL